MAQRSIEDIRKSLQHLMQPSVTKARGVASIASALLQTLNVIGSDRQRIKKLEQRVTLLENQLAQHNPDTDNADS
ncbi:hypothetical protein [Shimazuella kribbensis]|uniref:hypothetical protein n=1 Tax=Shimazuella kribbensis TaxID=139808 RepID=UPI00048EB53C|nr:hypothetical protein [Shimazuella kribbensis]